MGLEDQSLSYTRLLNVPKETTTKELVSMFYMNEGLENNIKYLSSYLMKKGWKFDDERKNFFKKENKINQNFRTLSVPKQQLTPIELSNIATEIMGKNAFICSTLDIFNKYTDTDFIISGIQHAFTPYKKENESLLLHQPVIRLNGSDQGNFFVSGEKGIGTSFVNTTKYKVNANIEDILEALEEFLNFLNKIGIYIGDISLKLGIEEDNRNGENMFIFMLHIFYGNLEIGDTSLIKGENNPTVIKDLGFGLERVNLARNKFVNYFEQYLNNKEYLKRFSDIEIDTIKTVCLMQTTNNRELLKNSGPHSTYLKLIRKLSKHKNYYPLLKIFIDYWGNFTTLPNGIVDTVLTDIEEYNN